LTDVVQTSPLLRTQGLELRAGAIPLEFRLMPGDIIGLAGLDGHGQDTFLKVLAGFAKAPGEVMASGRTIRNLADAVASAVVYVPRDRRATGLFPALSITDNFAISTAGDDRRGALISKSARLARYEVYRQRLGIVAPDPRAPITALSGGNQQKVLLARALARNPKILLMDDPTRGVDVATRHILYGLFRELAASGLGLIILSSEIQEVVALCNRVLVFRDYQVAASFGRDGLDPTAVIAAMFGRAT
jgi:ribose transport system ATP-binding protein